MNDTEDNVMIWIEPEWQSSIQSDDWEWICSILYGAIQACIQVDANEDYAAYKTLVEVARQHRMDSFFRKYKEAA